MSAVTKALRITADRLRAGNITAADAADQIEACALEIESPITVDISDVRVVRAEHPGRPQ